MSAFMCKPAQQHLQRSARPIPCTSGHHVALCTGIACLRPPITPGYWPGMQQLPNVSKARLICSSTRKSLHSDVRCTANSPKRVFWGQTSLSSKANGSIGGASSSSSSGGCRSWRPTAVDADQQQTQDVAHQQRQQQQQRPAVQVQQLTCRRCFQQFSSAENSSRACSYHPAMYTGGEVAKVCDTELAACFGCWTCTLGRISGWVGGWVGVLTQVLRGGGSHCQGQGFVSRPCSCC
jgi:hypothetical protein